VKNSLIELILEEMKETMERRTKSLPLARQVMAGWRRWWATAMKWRGRNDSGR
jgi:hypothetical protein